ncbi:GNAT family N-acetyltransferase [Metabacillus litoralis]|uniref:GNAT family N-acetyltransferase n=1 Tax=Metabacillus litoralis TaxID=152268 RepID=UPI0021F5F929
MTKQDIQSVQRVAKTSWNTTYEGIIPVEIQENFIHTAYSDEMLEKRLLNTVFLVAEIDGEIIGFVNFIPLKNESKVELGAIYLYKEYQEKGIGTALLDEGIKLFPNVKKVYVNVEKENESGLSFYKARGFVIETEYDDLFDGHMLKTVRMILHL